MPASVGGGIPNIARADGLRKDADMGFSGSAADLAALKSELNTDPAGLGYLALVQQGNHQGLADMLNLARAGNTVRRGVRSALEVMSQIDGAAFAALTVGLQNFIVAVVSPGDVDLSSDTIRLSLAAIFPANSTGTALASRNRLIALADKTPASRGEALFGVDTLIGAGQVGLALRS